MIRRRTEDRVTRALVWSCVVVVVACTKHVDPEGHASSPSNTEVPSGLVEAEELPSSTTERSSPADSESRVSLRSAPSLRAAFVRERQREGASDARYRVVHERGELVARSPARRVTGRFDSDGFHVSSEDGPRGTLRTDALRCDDVRVPAGRGAFAPGDATNRVERAIGRGALVATEWIESGPLGLEQGFDVSASSCAELVVALAVEGLRPERSGDGAIEDTVRLVGDEGALAYGELFAIDADGRTLPARFAVNGQSLELVVDTRDATWPVVVDPLVYTEDQIVTPPEGLGSDGAVGDSFGYSVAIDGDLAIIGAPRDDIAGLVDVGSAYVFVRRGGAWVIEAKLVADDGAELDSFGWSVALSGDTALVGAQDANRIGAAYVFVREGTDWEQQATLVATDGELHDGFGCSVAMSGDTALVGAYGNEAAYVFARDGASWTQRAKLVPVDGSPFDEFGRNVALSGDTALIGADRASGGRGLAYVFLGSDTTWAQAAVLFAPDGVTGDRFGWSVALSGQTALVGEIGHEVGSDVGSGRAHVFVRSDARWGHQATLVASDLRASGQFGWSVALSGDTALVSVGRHGSSEYTGAAYVFTRSEGLWQQRAKLASGEAGHRFASTVALSSDRAIAGATGDGAAYVLERTESSWLEVKLEAGMGAQDARFGESVALTADAALVGSPGDDAYRGAAYVLVRSGAEWTIQAKLKAEDVPPGYSFGASVALGEGVALVGAPAELGRGSAYVFVRNGTHWERQARLAAADGSRGDLFGSSVSLAGDTALIGARGVNAAYVFVRSGATWVQETQLSGDGEGAFGASVALSADSALVGAPDDEAAGVDSGAAYVFVKTARTWARQAKLLPDDGAPGDFFGASVALATDTALIGAPRDDDAGFSSGSAYVFGRVGAGWAQHAKLLSGSTNDSFASCVALSNDVAVIGGSRGFDAFVRRGASWPQIHLPYVGWETSQSAAVFGISTLIGFPFQYGPSPYGNRSGAVYFGTVGWEGLDGQPCVAESDCDSGFCVDGVCCDTACGDGATDDCQACSIAAGAAVDGVCGATTGNACDDGLACTTLDLCDAGVCDGASACDDATSCTEASGAFVCGACPAGSLSVDGTGATECVPCATGTWSVAGATTCVPWTVCGVGSRVVSVASPSSDRECVPCEPGTFSSTTNAPVCIAWSDCPAGTFVREAGSATSDRTCDVCVSGFSSTTNAGSCAPWTECGVGEFSSSAPTSTRDRECTTCSRCDEGEVEISRCAEAADSVCARVDDAGIPIFDGGLDDGGLADGSVDARSDATEGGVSGGGGCGCHTSAPGGSAFGVLLGVGWMLIGRRRRRADR